MTHLDHVQDGSIVKDWRHSFPGNGYGLQAQRILHRIAMLVVVKVAIDGLAVACPRGEGAGPAGQGLLIITALVGPVGAVQAHVDEIGGDLLR